MDGSELPLTVFGQKSNYCEATKAIWIKRLTYSDSLDSWGFIRNVCFGKYYPSEEREAFKDTHSLQFLYTAVTPGENVTAVGLLNGEQIVYYDSNIKKMIPKTEWLQKISTDDTNYWNRETERVKDHQYQLQDIVTTMKILNQAEGDHTLQWMFGCGLDNGTIRGYSQYRYDGEDFMSLDLNWNQELGNGNWIAANEKAGIFIKEWNHKGENAIYWMNYLKTECIDQLKKFVPHGRETLESKVHSETPVCQKLSPFPELVCNATGVFPKPVMISWMKDGEDMHEDVELRMSLINQDGSFQMRSIMKVSVEELQKHNYTCVIQHSSLGKELVPNVNKHRTRRGSGGGSDRRHVGVIVPAVVTLLVLVAFVGMFIWKKIKSSGAENPLEVQRNGTEIHPLNTPLTFQSKPGREPPH
ncbi:DLA class I histocompatibility antigen, A9/A9 alpha chain-like isoform X2 [Tachysurus vachellii]|uniref:DLA class I histocompatibility antigen, A9/A9 alpha chain-like isoform X2 n=1 Tax=Tachysurus vachellii TaxID=175792 RepID=UPI00296AA783|nr:DLA class I histocompatibility antigen, A9/A9 alpha chain-like isoform X2 [Tachysurus vachellii]